jgi:lipopolysaccharide/colanic/teichoic acid biosynthesis glycosyltransferase
MLKDQAQFLRSLLLLAEVTVCAVLFAGSVAFAGAGTTAGEPAWHLLAVGLAASLALPLVIRAMRRSSEQFPSLVEHLHRLLAAGAVSVGLVAGVAFAVGSGLPPWTLFRGLAAQIGTVGLLRISAIYGIRHLRREGRQSRNVIVIGTGPRAQGFAETVVRHPEWGVHIVGYVDEGDVAWSEDLAAEHVTKLSEFQNLLRDVVIDEVVVACPRSMLVSLSPAIEGCAAAGVPLTLMNDLFGDHLPPPRTRQFGSQSALCFAAVDHNPLERAAKRGLDVVGAGSGLLLAAPVLLAAAAAVAASSRGPVLVREPRCGLHGRTFGLYKLRTTAGEPASRPQRGGVLELRQEHDITGVGRVLRAFRLDALPQLWNVLVGDMSLVGPLPATPAEVAQYTIRERRRLSMRPGLTCLWQVRDPTSHEHAAGERRGFDAWTALDVEYIDTWSLGQDLKLLLLTLPAALRRPGG